MALTSQVAEQYRTRFGADPQRIYRAPGRVNLIGEHTDYNLGFVCPIAIELACDVATGPNSEGMLRIYSANQEEQREWPVSALAEQKRSHHWTDYVLGVAQQVAQAGYPIAPANLLIQSTVPLGSGLSSSAAIEVSTALALLSDRAIDRLALARLCQRAENQFIGLPSGIMDQYVSVFGEQHAAIMLDCRSLRHQAVRLPEDVAIIAVNTLVKHELGQSAYHDRVRECQSAVAALKRTNPSIESLRDATVPQIEAARAEMGDIPYRRARHIVGENARVGGFAVACRAGDLTKMGELFVASHRSLQHDYEVSCAELDFLVDTALTLPGVYGARMTGGGFGGCTVTLTAPSAAAAFTERITAAYHAQFGIQPEVYRCEASEGAGPVT